MPVHTAWMPGSSPLTRGKLTGRDSDVPGGRLIPAHAGKTCEQARAACPTRAHPRSRGENIEDCVRVLDGEGSSPLTRGKRTKQRPELLILGLIPAHAGKTRTRNEPASNDPAHPRSRGENRAFDVLAVGRMGSSPLTRGKRATATVRLSRTGLIPAHAGKTRTRTSST